MSRFSLISVDIEDLDGCEHASSSRLWVETVCELSNKWKWFGKVTLILVLTNKVIQLNLYNASNHIEICG